MKSFAKNRNETRRKPGLNWKIWILFSFLVSGRTLFQLTYRSTMTGASRLEVSPLSSEIRSRPVSAFRGTTEKFWNWKRINTWNVRIPSIFGETRFGTLGGRWYTIDRWRWRRDGDIMIFGPAAVHHSRDGATPFAESGCSADEIQERNKGEGVAKTGVRGRFRPVAAGGV